MIETTITLEQFIQALLDTFYMVAVSLAIGSVIGFILGITVVVTRPGAVLENKFVYLVLNPVINVVRSLPFIILLVAIIPFTRLVVGTSIGTEAAIVPLIVFISPYIGRLVENSLLEVGSGILEAADAMGATAFQTITRFLLREARGSLVLSVTTATIGLIGATAMAGTVGGGGVGDLAISYGYNRFDNVAMIATVVALIVIVEAVQRIGNLISRRLRHDLPR